MLEAGGDGEPDPGFDGLRHDNFRCYHDNWKEDPGERGRRIWEWWRHWINTTEKWKYGNIISKFQYHKFENGVVLKVIFEK
jgi:hypothetical protein